jgi:hypothetical protein
MSQGAGRAADRVADPRRMALIPALPEPRLLRVTTPRKSSGSTGPSDFREFLRNRCLTITSRAREAGFFSHKPTRGKAREDVLVSPLRDILPARFEVTTGEVRAADGSVSGQWDVLIYDRANTPKLYDDPSASVLPIETVMAAISVKSKVNRKSIKEATEAALTLRHMPRHIIPIGEIHRFDSATYPAVYLFGFEGLTLLNTRKAIVDICNGQDPYVALNAICIHGTGVVLPLNAEGPSAGITGIENYDFAKTGNGSFGIFLAFLYAALMTTPVFAPDLIEYINLGRMAGHVPEG